ncbi:hypothetical protein [Massilia luteola]|uniref:hypothetical protein n=1 Tax=Massilia luteola TaxID=3081751 RepID=UPI002ACBECA5|nr:hypothetical protein [Massilia sp. Gc5]
MATFIKRGETWRAQIRRKGHKAVTATFPTKAQAQAWARKVEAEMDAQRFTRARGLANITLKELIDWYSEEIGGAHPFGKNKKAVLRIWARDHGELSLDKLTADYLTTYVRNRRKAGTSGVTIKRDWTHPALRADARRHAGLALRRAAPSGRSIPG